VVHRDLKPANVLVDWPSRTVKLADFGLARLPDAVQTDTGVVLGTPSYMAPEQIAGGLPTPQTDFYSLGVLLFELLTGRLPHLGNSMGELLMQVARFAGGFGRVRGAPAGQAPRRSLGQRPRNCPGLA
jgi:eukaryotic-like serine/threonine-protein kinase